MYILLGRELLTGIFSEKNNEGGGEEDTFFCLDFKNKIYKSHFPSSSFQQNIFGRYFTLIYTY